MTTGVELRWYQHPDRYVEGGGFATGLTVLQYRTLGEPFGLEGEIRREWSEWQDVPTVRG